MGAISIWHWVIVLVIVMLVFGTKKLRNVGSDIGGAVKGFREGLRDASNDEKSSVDASSSAQAAPGPGQVIEGEIKEKVNH